MAVSEATIAARVAAAVEFGLDVLAPGVRGWASEQDDWLLVSFIAADNPGNGDVGRYLGALPKEKPVAFLEVLSPVLAGMLARRGFKRGWLELVVEGQTEGERVSVMLRVPARTKDGGDGQTG